MRCRRCTAVLPRGAVFCPECGLACDHPAAWAPLPPAASGPSTPGTPGRAGLVVGLVATLVLAVGGAAAFLLLRPGPSAASVPATTAAAASGPTVEPTPTGAAPTLAPPSVAGTPAWTPAPPPPVAQPAQPAQPAWPAVVVSAGKECGRFGTGPWAAVGTYNATTSCPFALNVRKAYLADGLDGGTGTIEAYSPTTRKHYVMTCWGSQPARCEGGVAARVMIYGGDFVLDPKAG